MTRRHPVDPRVQPPARAPSARLAARPAAYPAAYPAVYPAAHPAAHACARRLGTAWLLLASGMVLAQPQAPAAPLTPASPATELPAPAPAAGPATTVPGETPVASDLLQRPDDGTGEAVDQRSVVWTLAIDAPEPLRALLARHLDLSRFQPVAAAERITRVELARLLAAAPQQARGLLETEGYFSAQVQPEVKGGDGVAPTSTAPAAEATRPLELQVTLRVTPGPRTEVGTVRIEVEGPLSAAVDAADADAAELLARIRDGWSLGNGAAYTQSAWGAAKAAVLTRARAEGYALATLSGSVAEVDPVAHRAQLYVVLDSGPLLRFGALRFEGLQHVDPEAVHALLNFQPGERLREQQLLDFQDRLVKSGLFETVAVLYEPDPGLAEATPITIRVTEQARQQATFGVGVSDASGPRVTVEHLHQRVFGLGWQAKSRLQLGRTAQALSVDLTSHPQPGPYRNLIGASMAQTDASGLQVTSERVRLGRTQDTERVERLYFVEWQRALTRDLVTDRLTDDTTALTLNYHWVWRELDQPILPTQGYSLSAETAVGHSFASTDRSGWFGRATGRLTTYWPLGQSWYGQARVQLGQVFARDATAVPFTLLFRAGGDDSVRGYAYQSLGPTDASGSATGARVMGTASVELARPFSRGLPQWWWATFVDVGGAAPSWRDFSGVRGYGVGVRWRSPVGPLRIDLAYGEQVRRVRLHFSVGITF